MKLKVFELFNLTRLVQSTADQYLSKSYLLHK